MKIYCAAHNRSTLFVSAAFAGKVDAASFLLSKGADLHALFS